MAWKQLSQKVLIFWLLFAQALLPVSNSFSFAADSSSDPIQVESNALAARIQALIIDAENPNTLSVGKVAPEKLRQRLQELQEKFFEWKERIKSDIANPEQHDYENITKQIVSYFTQLSSLVLIESFLSLPAATSVSQDPAFELPVPLGKLATLSGFSLIGFEADPQIKKIMTDPNSLITVDAASLNRPGLGEADFVRLKLGSVLAEILRKQAVANSHTDRAFLLLSKYIAVHQLLSQFEEVNSYRRVPEPRLPRLSQALTDALSPLGDLETPVADTAQVGAEQDFRAALIQQLPHETSAEFASDEFLSGLEAMSGQEVRLAGKTMRENEQTHLKQYLSPQIQSYPVPLGSLADGELRSALRKCLAQAKFYAIMAAIPQVSLPILQWVNARVRNYELEIPEAFISAWLSQARQAQGSSARQQRNRNYVKDLVRKATYLQAELGPDLLKTAIDLSVLQMALAPAVDQIGLKEEETRLVKLILGAPSYELARFACDKVEKKLAAQHQDAANIEKLGHLYGFDRTLSAHPRVDELKLSSAQLEAYREAKRRKELTSPILSLELPGQHPWDPLVGRVDDLVNTHFSKKPLYELLAAAQSRHDTSEELSLTERALIQVQENIRQDLDQLAKTTTLPDLAALMAKSKFMFNVMDADFPVFQDYQQRLAESAVQSVKDRSMITDAIGAYSGPMNLMIYTFATSILQITFPAARWMQWINRAQASLTPHIAGYMMISMPLIVASSGVDVWQAQDAYQQLEQKKRFFYSSATSASFFDYPDLIDAQEDYKLSSSSIITHGAIPLLFMAVPSLAYGSRLVALRWTSNWRAHQFHTLGFPKGNSVWDEKQIRAQADREAARVEAENGHRPGADRKVREAERNLLEELRDEELHGENFKREFRIQFQDLGLFEGKETFDTVELERAYQTIHSRYKAGRTTLQADQRARRALEELIQYRSQEWSFAQSQRERLYNSLPGPLKNRIPAPQGGGSEVRRALLRQVYGYERRRSEQLSTHFNPGKRNHFSNATPENNLYAVLGVGEHASQTEIKEAYRKLVKKWHPDVIVNEKAKTVADEKIKEINNAYSVLRDPQAREEYDANRRGTP